MKGHLSLKKIIFIGLLSFLLAALWQLPLSFAKPYAEKMVAGLKLTGVSGTVWNGKAQNLTINDNNLGHIDWKVKPLQSLTSLSLKSTFNLSGKQISANGIAAVTPSKKLIIDNTTFNVDASYLNAYQKHAKLTGDIKGTINHTELDLDSKVKKLPILDAIIDWKQATVSSLLLNLSAGDYHIVITPDSEGLLITPSSKEAPLEINGKINLSNDWLLQPNIKLKSNDQRISGMLKLAGKTQADGSTLINSKTNLKPFLKIK